MIRLIATDLDGTLLENGAMRPPEAIFPLIQRLWERGVTFCAASGRQYGNLTRLFAPACGKMAFIGENGAVAAAGGTIFHTLPIPRDMGRAIIREIQARGHQVLVSGKYTSYVVDRDRRFTDHIVYDLCNTVTVVDDLTQIEEEYLKISAYCWEGSDAAAAGYLENWRGKLNAAIAGQYWFDFTVADKGKGMEALLKRLSIQPEEAMAFGDNENDVAMLSLVKHPFLMETASPSLRRPGWTLCGHVTDELEKLLAEDGLTGP